MSLFDCPKCWSIPCCCGYEYRDMLKENRIEIAAAALGLDEKTIIERLADIIPEKHPRNGEK